MSHYCLVSTVIIRYFFVTLGHHIADPVTGFSPSIHLTHKNSHSRLFLDSFTQCWPLNGTGLGVCGLAYMGFRVVAKNIADCSLGGPVLNLLPMGEN